MPRKGENIYKRKDGRWEGRYIKSHTPEGKAVYGYVYSRTYREAKEKLAAAAVLYKSRDETSCATPSGETLFRAAADHWLSSVLPHVKESTANKYRNLLTAYILPQLGEVPLREITSRRLETHCTLLLTSGGRKKTGLSPKTVSDVLTVIRSILQCAIRNREMAPLDTKIQLSKPEPKEMRVLSRGEQFRLCAYLCGNWNGFNLGILVCLFTGLRIGEICALRWEDISLTEHTIHVHQTLQRVQNQTASEKRTKIAVTSPKSTCSIRTVPFSNELAGLIAAYKTVSAGYFLTNSSHKYIEPRTMENHFKAVLKESGVEPANYHALRHTFATRCVELGVDVKSLSEILGHASVTITMNRYVHPSMELKKENMQRLSALFAVR